MRPPIDFFFSLGSTYTYLAINRVGDIAAREGVELRWQPFAVRHIMREQNNVPFTGKPVKTKYMWRDIERRAAGYGIPFNGIPSYPVDPELLANRVARIAADEGWCPDYTRAMYHDWFIEHQVPGDEARLRMILDRLGKDAEAIIALAKSPEGHARFDAATDQARQLGIFGSPTFVVDKEIFWGDDRFEDAVAWAKSRPPFVRPR